MSAMFPEKRYGRHLPKMALAERRSKQSKNRQALVKTNVWGEPSVVYKFERFAEVSGFDCLIPTAVTLH